MRRLSLVLFSVLFIAGGIWFVETHPSVVVYVSTSLKETSKNLAAVFFQESITIAQID